MSSVPGEVLRDVLLLLGRWTLDNVQLTGRRFLKLIAERMSDVCLRQIFLAAFGMPENEENAGESWFIIRIDVSPSPEIRNRHEDTARLFSEFVQALRSCGASST